MFQEIQPHILDIQYLPKEITPLDYVVILNKNKILMRDVDGVAQYRHFRKYKKTMAKSSRRQTTCYQLKVQLLLFDIELKEKTDLGSKI